MNIMGGCMSFLIKVQILAFYTDLCTAPKARLFRPNKVKFSGGGRLSFRFRLLRKMEKEQTEEKYQRGKERKTFPLFFFVPVVMQRVQRIGKEQQRKKETTKNRDTFVLHPFLFVLCPKKTTLFSCSVGHTSV